MAKFKIGLTVWLVLGEAFFVFGANSHVTLGALVRSLGRPSEVNNIQIQFSFLSEVMLKNYAMLRLETFSNTAAQHGASAARILTAERPLLSYVNSTTNRIRRESRRGDILIAGSNARVVSTLVSADLFPPFDRTDVRRVSVLSGTSYTDFRVFNRKSGGSQQREADITSVRPGDFQKMGLPFMFIAEDMISALRSLTNVTVESRVGKAGERSAVVTGLNLDSGDTFKIYFGEKMLPRRLLISDGGEIIADIELRCQRDPRLGVIVDHERFQSYQQGIEDYIENWTFSNYVANVAIKNNTFHVSIPALTLVDDDRFGKPFTYLMGSRPPTERQLIKMSQNRNGRQQYYQSAGLAPSKQALQRTRMRTYVVLTILVASTVIFLATMLKARKKRTM